MFPNTKQIILLVSLIINLPSIHGQIFKMSFSKLECDTSTPVISNIYSAISSNIRDDSVIFLKNNETINRYNIFKLCIQPKKNPSKYDSILLLVGFINSNIIMIVDKNRNNSFSDDEVYKTNIKLAFRNNKQFRNVLPLIGLDSIRILDRNDMLKYASLKLRFSPSLGNNSLFHDSLQIKAYNKYSLCIYSGSYFSTSFFNYRGVKYSISITPDPLTFPFYPIRNSKFSRATISVYKYSSDGFRMVNSGLLEYALDKNQPIIFDNNKMSIIKADFDSNNIVVNIDSSTTGKNISLKTLQQLPLYSLKYKKITHLNIENKDFTIFEFSGSWCVPCASILPEVKQMQEKLKPNVQLVTVQVEKNTNTAKSFYQKSQIGWDAVFEDLSCNSRTCLKTIFNVGLYPSFLLIDKSGNILLNETGSEGLEKIEKYFNIN